MATFRSFEDITAWQAARELARNLHAVTRCGTFARDRSLVDQMTRAVSIMSNIAEGFERGGRKEFIQYVSIAKGSSGELRSQLYVALDRRHISEAAFTELRNGALQASRLIAGLINYLRNSEVKGVKYKQHERDNLKP